MHASPGDFGEGCAQHESTQPLSPDKTRANSVGHGRQIQDLRGGRGVQGVQGCLGGGSRAGRGVHGGVQGRWAFRAKKRQKHERTRKAG